MLEAIRKHAGSLVVKILFAVLVLSFVVWGVADVFRPGGGGDWAAEVAGVKIATPDFQEEYRVTLQRVGQSFGGSIDAEQARALGLPQSVLNRMIDGVLLDKAAADLGVTVTDAAVREAIKGSAQFRNELGQFDPQVFRSALARNSFSEERYVELLRRELQREQLVGSLTEGVAPPKAMLQAMQQYQGERRVAEWLRVSDAAAGSIADADEPTLRQFHQDYPGLFAAPEYRALTMVVLAADGVAKGITVDDSALQTAYQERLAEFTRPERRSFRQVVYADEAAAERARRALAGGASFASVAAEAGQPGADKAPIGPVGREQLPAELAASIFDGARDGVGQPVRSPLGWHLVEVIDIAAGAVQPFAEAKERLAAELKREKAVDALIELGDRLEDTLGRGATLDEAANELGLPVRKIAAVDARSRDPAGTETADLPSRLIDTAFKTAAQTESALIEADRDTYFVVRVDAVTPTAVKPFESVRTAVAEAWRARQRNDRAKQQAEALAERVRAGAALAAAGEKGPKPATTPPFTRTGEGAPDLPRALSAALFSAKPGEAVVVPVDDGWAVARLAAILPPATDAGQAPEAGLRSELAEQLRGDVMAQFAAGLRRRSPVKINPRVLEQSL